jgi:uncharacterized membrane protein
VREARTARAHAATSMSGSAARRGLVLDVVFLVGVVLKGLDGLAELAAGIPLVFLSHGQLASLAVDVTADELREDPNDLIAHLILHGVASTTSGTLLFLAAYLVVHGVVKTAVVVALVIGARRIYPWAIAVLIAFTAFQLGDLVIHPSIGVAALTALDVVVIALTWREWRSGRTFRETTAGVLRAVRSGPRADAGSRRSG